MGDPLLEINLLHSGVRAYFGLDGHPFRRCGHVSDDLCLLVSLQWNHFRSRPIH